MKKTLGQRISGCHHKRLLSKGSAESANSIGGSSSDSNHLTLMEQLQQDDAYILNLYKTDALFKIKVDHFI